MQRDTRVVRHLIYDYLTSRGFDLTQEDKVFLSSKIQEHSGNRDDNLKDISRKYVFAQDKIARYLQKAKELPIKTPKIETQIETLKLVSSWLNTQIDN